MNLTLKIITLILVILLSACEKEKQFSKTDLLRKEKKNNIPPAGFFVENRKVPNIQTSISRTDVLSSKPEYLSANSSSSDPDNGDLPIILGQQLANPYSVANMQQAVNILYGGNYPISATHLYVRFLPASVEQVVTLEDSADLELQDHPMDYEIIQDGDYYQDPSQGTEAFQWLYTVVEVGYNFPPGIQMQVLESLYLPENNEILEDLAESMAAGGLYSSMREDGSSLVQIQRLDTEVGIFNYTTEQCPCYEPDQPCPVWPDCGIGGGGGGTPPPTLDAGIFVEEQTVCNQPTVTRPLREARVVAKRWFKVWRGYTDNNGDFVVTKNFKNNVKVIVKTKNNHARISKVRGIRLWQMLFPCKRQIGVFNGNSLSSIRFVFTKPANGGASSRELANWAAATTHNGLVEFRQYSAEFGLPLPPSKLKIMVTNWSFMENSGAAPMWNKCNNNVLPTVYAAFFVASQAYVAAGFTVLLNTLKNQMDVIIGYKSTDYNCRLTSSQLRAVVYHELGHAQHFAQVGCDFWSSYRNAITSELLKLDQIDFHPYGTGNDANTAPILAVGEMWGNHAEKWYSERHYGNGGSNGGFGVGFTARMQVTDWQNIPGGLNANLNAIENHNPTINLLFGTIVDPHQWIPQGLPYDLIDNRNDFDFDFNLPVDNVFGYTTQQCFNALQGDVRSIPAFRGRILQQNGNNQAANVNDLFFRYGY